MGQPVKLSDSLVVDARMAGEVEHRSIAGQIEYWASLGEALEPLLRGLEAMALIRSKAAEPLSALLDSVDSPEGRRRVAERLKTMPLPRFEPAPGRRGLLVRVAPDGTRTVGRFVKRRFVPAA